MKKTLQSQTNKVKNILFYLLAVSFMLFTSVNNVSAMNLQQETISVKVKNVSLKEFLLELTKKYNFELVYSNNDIVAVNKKITVSYQNTSLDIVLNSVLKDTGLSYRVEKNSISIFKDQVQNKPKAEDRQRETFKGTVLDNKNKPVIGATVILKGTMVGAITDEKGKFAITAYKGDNVEISFIGFISKDVKLSEVNPIIRLEKDVIDGGEVVVTGYGNVRKESFTGNVTIVKKQDLLNVNNKNVIAALQAFDPSFRIKENSIWGSDPNKLPEFNIRGESSIAMKKGLDVELDKRTQRMSLQDNPNIPIFILDGFEVSVQRIYDMDINLIESMTILKDAAATAMYGSRAANGVIVVVSVPPVPGKLRVTYNMSMGAEFPDLSDYNLCNAAEKLELERLAGLYYTEEPALREHKYQEYNEKLNQIKRGVNTDWLAIPLQNVFNHTHSANISGGADNIRYSMNLNYGTGNGAMKGSYRDRLGASFTLDYRHNKWLQLMNTTSFNNTKAEDSPWGNFSTYSDLQPYLAVYDDEGELLNTLSDGKPNPIWQTANMQSFSGRSRINDISNNFMLNLYFLDGFTFKTSFSISNTNTKNESFVDPKDPDFLTYLNIDKGSLMNDNKEVMNWNLKAMLYYSKSINNHYINVTAGYDMMERSEIATDSYYQGFQLGNLSKPSFAAKQPNKTGYNSNASRLVGITASANYTYKDIYLFDASFRLDGSSQFGTDKRFAPFWSVGAGLNIHKYDWFKDINSSISRFKLRATYGHTGNVNFPAYSAVTTYKISSDSWYYTGPAASLIYLGNPLLTWETTKTFDTGLSFGFKNDNYLIELNYYNKKTVDLLTEMSVRQSSGFNNYFTNTGSITNKGYEIKVTALLFRNRNWMVTTFASINGNKNRITELGKEMVKYNQNIIDNYNAKQSQYPQLATIPLIQYYVGASTTAIYAVPSYGIDPANGKEKFRKKNDSSSYIWNAEDQIVCGDSSPKAQGSFNLNVSYKSFYINTTFMFQWGSQTYNETLLRKVENAAIATSNVDKRVLTERWRKPGDVAPYYDLTNTAVTKPTSRFVQDYNYLNFSSLAVGYDFLPKVYKKLGMTALGLRFNANEVVRWSSVKEERGTSYPYAKNYSFTLNIGF